MEYIEKIDAILHKLQNGYANRLSAILPELYPIAIECEDYEGFCILFLWGNTIVKNKEGNAVQLSALISMLTKAGLSTEKAEEIQRRAFEEYLAMRTVESDRICSFSAREMEDYFVRADSMISAAEVPDGLAPIDLYYRSNQATSQKLSIIQNRQEIDKQYAVLHSLITSKLACYRIILSQNEHKKRLKENRQNSRKVFIIHGHNEAKRRELIELLKNLSLDPIILSDQPNQGLTIIEKFEKCASECSYAFALFTPDDIVTDSYGKQYFQARPNVIFELGWFYAHLGRTRVCILDQSSEKSVIFSDLQGVMRIQFTNDISEKYIEIERELKTVGIID